MANKLLIHIGTGDDRKTYTFDEDKVLNVEWIAIEETTGRAPTEIMATLPKASMISVTAIVWILRRREEPGLQFEDVQFPMGDLEVEPAKPTVPKEEGPEDLPAPN